jgi:hypothetical protein
MEREGSDGTGVFGVRFFCGEDVLDVYIRREVKHGVERRLRLLMRLSFGEARSYGSRN